MSELLIEKDKKSEWIAKRGGKKGLEFLENIVKELSESENLIIKNDSETEDKEIKSEKVETETLNSEPETKNEIVKENSESETKTESESKEVKEETKGVELNLKSFMDNTLKAYTGDVIQPLYDSLWKLEETVASLAKENGDLRTTLKTILEQLTVVKSFTLFETVPSASYDALINKENRKKTVFETPVEKTDAILKDKPVENKVKIDETVSVFTGFLDGK